jgi:putative flippase GtrA
MASSAPETGIIGRITALIAAVRRGELRWLAYVGASVIALGTDGGLFLILLDAGLTPLVASSLGYIGGIFVHWLVSSRLVFADGTAAPGSSERRKQKGLFIGSALVGLGITAAIVGGGAALGLDPRIAKLIAIAVSFQATYLLRRHVVFRG